LGPEIEGDIQPSDALEEMAEKTAAALAEAAAHLAFRLFYDKKIRRLAAFDVLSQTEQDRVFNELVVAFLVLIMLVLEAPDLRVDEDYKEYLAEMKKEMSPAQVTWMPAMAARGSRRSIRGGPTTTS
jgi:hypothetical protein